MRRKFLCFLAAFMLPTVGVSQERVQIAPRYVDALRATGVDVSLRNEGARTGLDIVVQIQDFIAAVPSLQARNLLNPDITRTEAQRRLFSLAWVYAQECSGMLLEPLYNDNPRLSALTVRLLVSFPDHYGNLKRELLCSFDFDRRLFEKINWKNFEAPSLSRIAPNYQTTPFLRQKFAAERSY